MTENEPSELASLRQEMEALRREVRELRGEIAALKKIPPPPPRPPLWPKPPAAPAPKPAPVRIPLSSRLRDLFSAEQFIGERLLHYAGLAVLAVGILFFLIWRAAHTGPWERLLMAAAAGAALIFLGTWLLRRPPYDRLSNGIIAGGWSVLYLAAFAARHIEATRVVESPPVELALLTAVAAGMIAHALALRSRAFRLFAFGLTYFVLFLNGTDAASFGVFPLLLGASAAVAAALGHADALLASVVGFYCNFIPLFLRVMAASGDGGGWSAFSGPFLPLALGYGIPASLPVIAKARESLSRPGEEKAFDAALCLNAAAFAVLSWNMAAACFHPLPPAGAAGLSALVAAPGLLYLFSPTLRRLDVCSAVPAMGLLILAMGIARMPSPLWKMLAWSGAVSGWAWVGLRLDQRAWRASAAVMAVLTFAFYFHVAGPSEAGRRAASSALLLFSALSYLASGFYLPRLKGEPAGWELKAPDLWLHAGSAALVLALWGLLESAPFALACMALAVCGEFASGFFRRPALWGQASALSAGSGLYAFFIDFGADLPVLPGATPRLLVSLCLTAAMAYLYFFDPAPAQVADRWPLWTRSRHRAALSWLLCALGAYAVYHEFGPLLRLPVWALASTALYHLGRARQEERLKAQGLLLAMTAAVEGVFSYLLYPKALLAGPSALGTCVYWGSALLILLNLFLAKDERRPRTSADLQAPWVFSALSQGLIAFYLAKELSSYLLTLAWSFEGLAFLSLGIFLNVAELRRPALALLGVCAFKAILLDTSRLPLPQRVASLIALGVILLLSSMMYVRLGRHGEKDSSDRPG
jgi:uncharacterized membrane protein